jgi:fumarate reductase flavoprotein subunit
MSDKKNFTRRSFLSGMGVVAAGAAATGLAGCSGKSKTAEEAAKLKESGLPAVQNNRWISEAGRAWRTPPSAIDEKKITDKGEFDLVIVGGGQSGVWTARSASMNGLKVAVIEAQPEETMLWVGGEVGTINSKWALDHGAKETDKQEFMREAFRRNAGRSNQRMLKDYCDYSGQILDWAIGQMDESWMLECTHVQSCPPDDRMILNPSNYQFFLGTVIFREPTAGLSEWCWREVLKKQVAAAKNDGATWFYRTHAEYLEKDSSGRVNAVVCQNRDDQSYVRVRATKGVVLAGGDFGGNVDMLRDINDEYRHLAEAMGDIELAACSPMLLSRDGSAISMGVWAGGHIEVGPHAAMNTGQAGPEAPWGPGTLMLNQLGRRFCDEVAGGTEGSAYLVPRQPKGSVVTITDANWEDIVYAMPPAHGAVDYRRTIGWPKTVSEMSAVKPASTPTTVAAYSSPAEVFCANTIEELVKIVGVWSEDEQKTAIEEIKRYQSMAAAGVDDDFAKDPRILAYTKCDTAPFYAVVGKTTGMNPGLCQTCGLDTDDTRHVLDSDMMPIPGLFAVGNNSGNRFVVQYATPLAGMSLGFCMTEGMLLGTRIAKGTVS